MNKLIIFLVIIILLVGTITNGVLYVQEHDRLEDAQSQILALDDDISTLQEYFQSQILVLDESVAALLSIHPKLGQEFSLFVGQSILIADDDYLILTFEEVLKDNRCPQGVVCITNGEVICRLSIAKENVIFNIELSQPGLSDEYVIETHEGYNFIFKVEPYPQIDREISENEYRIFMTVDKQP